jgi:catechol 2,3-dioxygenase-like lactoylglutathione lyase family enzyme
MLSVSDIDAAKEFYLDKLGLTVIESYTKFFAVKAGDVRFSIFAGGVKRPAGDDGDAPASIILRTADLAATMAELSASGIEFESEAVEAPNFMRYVPLLDPDGNRIHIAQYLADPFAAT